MKSSQWKPSAGTITTGVVLLVLGHWLLGLGQQMNLEASVLDRVGEAPGSGWIVAALVVGLTGLVTLGLGVWQLATNVDLAGLAAARSLWAREQAERAERAEPAAENV